MFCNDVPIIYKHNIINNFSTVRFNEHILILNKLVNHSVYYGYIIKTFLLYSFNIHIFYFISLHDTIGS